ncbi:MAG: hypothetical protein NTU41_04410 [Chloroflexi bacterium]|nr:hypothetical protein [Chloroflexota bacterium]
MDLTAQLEAHQQQLRDLDKQVGDWKARRDALLAKKTRVPQKAILDGKTSAVQELAGTEDELITLAKSIDDFRIARAALVKRLDEDQVLIRNEQRAQALADLRRIYVTRSGQLQELDAVLTSLTSSLAAVLASNKQGQAIINGVLGGNRPENAGFRGIFSNVDLIRGVEIELGCGVGKLGVSVLHTAGATSAGIAKHLSTLSLDEAEAKLR